MHDLHREPEMRGLACIAAQGKLIGCQSHHNADQPAQWDNVQRHLLWGQSQALCVQDIWHCTEADIQHHLGKLRPPDLSPGSCQQLQMMVPHGRRLPASQRGVYDPAASCHS